MATGEAAAAAATTAVERRAGTDELFSDAPSGPVSSSAASVSAVSLSLSAPSASSSMSPQSSAIVTLSRDITRNGGGSNTRTAAFFSNDTADGGGQAPSTFDFEDRIGGGGGSGSGTTLAGVAVSDLSGLATAGRAQEYPQDSTDSDHAEAAVYPPAYLPPGGAVSAAVAATSTSSGSEEMIIMPLYSVASAPASAALHRTLGLTAATPPLSSVAGEITSATPTATHPKAATEAVDPPAPLVIAPPAPPFFVPKCITLLSRWSFPAFRTLLTEMYRLTLSPQPLPLERLVVNVCKEVRGNNWL